MQSPFPCGRGPPPATTRLCYIPAIASLIRSSRMSKRVGRRNFLKQVAVVGTAAAGGLPTVEAAAAPAQAPAPPVAPQSKNNPPVRDGFTFLTAPEAAFVE